MCTTSSDISQWMMALLRGFHHLDPSLEGVVPKDVLQDIFQPQILVTDPFMMVPEYVTPQAPISLVYDKYGLGWFVGRYNSRFIIPNFRMVITILLIILRFRADLTLWLVPRVLFYDHSLHG